MMTFELKSLSSLNNEKGKFPTQIIENPQNKSFQGHPSNPSHTHEQAKSITTLRSGRVLDNHVSSPQPPPIVPSPIVEEKGKGQ